jgi:hypothetical protein
MRLRGVAIEKGLSRGMNRFAKGCRKSVQSAIAQDAAQGTFAAPVAAWMDCDFARHIVLVVIDI